MMFWIFGFLLSLVIMYLRLTCFFGLRKAGIELGVKLLSVFFIACLLPFFSLAVITIKFVNYSDEIKIIFMTAGSLVCLLVMFFAERSKPILLFSNENELKND